MDLFSTHSHPESTPPALLTSLICAGDFGAAIRHLSAMRVQEMRLALLKSGFSVTTTQHKATFLSEMRGQIEAACEARTLPLQSYRHGVGG